MITAHNGLTHGDLRALKRDLQDQDRAHQSARGRLKHELELVDAALARVSPEAIRVTDHAVVRWLERVEGYDVASLRQRVAQIVWADDGVGADREIAFDRGQLILQDGSTVVTVLDLTQRPKRRAAGRRVADSPFAALAGLKFDKPKPPAATHATPPKPTFMTRLGAILSGTRGAQ